ncbi:uncharacterized protein At4g15970-like isoform X2 [Magnolia sinica]|uniref:uncharacterized protein At4g15970-like isoform X2 n=1 Tax=Magnolia sinica TaxID=86752 RepID=UPI00265B4EA6|nr:uncharacterized protein At4g15970-like isoform X2 [Magnolia sinica]
MKRAAFRSSFRRQILSTMPENHETVSDSGNLRRILTILLFLAAVAFPCVVLYRVAHPIDYLSRADSISSESRDPLSVIADFLAMGGDGESDSEDVRLKRILKEAAMEDGTVILTTLNEAWAATDSIIDLFLESFRIGYHTRRLLNHLVVVTLDPKAYARCLSIHSYCFALTTKGVDFSGEKYFMTPDYLTMMWRRIDFLRSVLEMGFNFIFTDADIMWFRDPFPRFYADADFQIACDHFSGDPASRQNRPNGGFNYVKSNNQTIQFYKFWYESREAHPGLHDQDVLNVIKFDPFISEIGLEIKFLDTAFFGGLCEPSRDLNKVCTMHANCCYGLDSKLHDLRIMLEDWRRFMSLSPSLKLSPLSSWRVPQNCRLFQIK